MNLKSIIKNTLPPKQLHDRYKDLVQTLPVAVYLCNADGYVTTFNEAAVKLWGRRPEIGKDLWCGSWKIYEPDGTVVPLDTCPMAETLKGQKPVVGREIVIEQPNGKRFHVLPHPHPLYDENGVLTGAINILVDLTDQIQFRDLQKETEQLSNTVEALKRSEERYHRMIVEVQDYAIILLSTEGIIENWNKGA